MVNILKGKGCVAPEQRLPIFEMIYNKEDYKAELAKKEQERNYKGNSNSFIKQSNQGQSSYYRKQNFFEESSNSFESLGSKTNYKKFYPSNNFLNRSN